MTAPAAAVPARKPVSPLVIGAIAASGYIAASASQYYHWHVAGSAFHRSTRADVAEAIHLAARLLAIVAATTILRHRRGNLAAWLLLLGSLAGSVASFSNAYVWFGYVVDRYATTRDIWASVPGRPLAGWLYGTCSTLNTALRTAFILLFPYGKLPGPRWKPVAWAVFAISGVTVVASAFARSVVASSVVSTPNPFRIEALNFLSVRLVIGSGERPLLGVVNYAVLFAISCAALVRWRLATPGERPAMRLFLVALVLFVGWVPIDAASLVTGDTSPYVDDLLLIASTVGALAFAVALVYVVFRSRLYEIELVIRRTSVLSSVALLIGAAYIGSSSLVGSVAGRVAGGWLVPMSATAVAAVGLRPMWELAERGAARVVLGDRPSPPEVLGDVALDVAAVGDVDEVPASLARTIARATGASAVVVRLASSPPVEAVVGERGQPAAQLALPVRFGSDDVGEIIVARRRSEPWGADDVRLLNAVAAQAGPALHNAIVLADLRNEVARVQADTRELAASRRRMATAQLDARARFADDITTHVMPELDAAEELASAARFDAARDRAERALTAVRTIGHGLEPSELRDLGIGPAVVGEARARGVSLSLEVGEDATTRWPRVVEAGAFACLVAAVRATGATRAHVSFHATGDGLAFSASSDGASISPGLALDLVDRVSARGGELFIESDGRGVSVRGHIPTGGNQ